MKKIYAAYPPEREKDCNCEGTVAYTGRVPCTGPIKCWMCGKQHDEFPHVDTAEWAKVHSLALEAMGE